jgi:hypothetical protein
VQVLQPAVLATLHLQAQVKAIMEAVDITQITSPELAVVVLVP